MSQEWKAPTDTDDDVQMPMGVSSPNDAPVEEYTPSGPKFRINSSTLALICSFGAALSVLYFLGQQNRPRAASASEMQQTQELDNRIREWDSRHPGSHIGQDGADKGLQLARIITSYFNAPRNGDDDPGDNDVWSRPTKVVVAPPTTGTQTQPSYVDVPVPLPPDPNLVEAAKEYGGLKLQLIMVGRPSSSALINNQLVQIGTKFKFLTVADIQPDCVILSYGDQKYKLTSGNGPGK